MADKIEFKGEDVPTGYTVFGQASVQANPLPSLSQNSRTSKTSAPQDNTITFSICEDGNPRSITVPLIS